MSKNGILAKIYHHNGEVLLAACDEELVGKYFEEGDLQLEVHETFYSGFRIDEPGLIRHLKSSTIANLVGKIVVDCAQRAGFLSEECVIYIQGIPHAQICRLGG